MLQNNLCIEGNRTKVNDLKDVFAKSQGNRNEISAATLDILDVVKTTTPDALNKEINLLDKNKQYLGQEVVRIDLEKSNALANNCSTIREKESKAEYVDLRPEKGSKEVVCEGIETVGKRLVGELPSGLDNIPIISLLKEAPFSFVRQESGQIILDIFKIARSRSSIDEMDKAINEFKTNDVTNKFVEVDFKNGGCACFCWGQPQPQLIEYIDQEYVDLTKEQLENKIQEEQKEKGASKESLKSEIDELEKINFYKKANFLRDINISRLTDASVSLGANSIKLSGDVMLIATGGVTVFTTLRAISNGVEITFKYYKDLVKYGREKAADSKSLDCFRSVFDKNRTPEAFKMNKESTIVFLLDMVDKNFKYESKDTIDTSRIKKIESYFTAAGFSLEELYDDIKDPEKLRSLLEEKLIGY